MNRNLDSIFFDIGGTLRHVVKDEALQKEAEDELYALAGQGVPRETFLAQLESRWRAYRRLAQDTCLEASETELWVRYLLPDQDPNRVAKLSHRLETLFRKKDGRREMFPGEVETLQGLKERGYRLGIISNTVTETEIPDWIADTGLAGVFTTVLLSSKVRLRKPDPEIFRLAARCMGTTPEHCAYVGDNPKRDVVSAKKAGVGFVVLFHTPGKTYDPADPAAAGRDADIFSLPELLQIFPALEDAGERT